MTSWPLFRRLGAQVMCQWIKYAHWDQRSFARHPEISKCEYSKQNISLAWSDHFWASRYLLVTCKKGFSLEGKTLFVWKCTSFKVVAGLWYQLSMTFPRLWRQRTLQYHWLEFLLLYSWHCVLPTQWSLNLAFCNLPFLMQICQRKLWRSLCRRLGWLKERRNQVKLIP